MVNADLLVQEWNRPAENLWGLRRDEAVGQHFLNLDIGLPTEQLRSVIRRALGDRAREPQEVILPAVNRRGRTVNVRVVCTPLARDGGSVSGAILVMEQDDASPRPRS